MWLLRGLSFTHQSLETAQRNPNTELAEAFTKGYEGSLKQHHNFIVKGIFSVCYPVPFFFLSFFLCSCLLVLTGAWVDILLVLTIAS